MSTFYKRDGCNGSPAVMRRLIGGDSHPIAVGMNDCKDEELIAMSAAPELVAALETCVEMLAECLRTAGCNDQADTIDSVMQQANKALDKADSNLY